MKDGIPKNYPAELLSALRKGEFFLVGRYLHLIREESPALIEAVISILKIGRRRAYYLIALKSRCQNFR